MKGNEDFVEFLLKNGADVNAKDKNGMTALHFFAQNYGGDQKKLSKFATSVFSAEVVETKAGCDSKSAFERIVDMLMAKSANVNAVDKKGWTPLHYAASRGHAEVIQILTVNYSAKVNVRANPNKKKSRRNDNEKGDTPLDLAFNKKKQTHNYLLSAYRLREKGALRKHDVDGGFTPLHAVARDGKKLCPSLRMRLWQVLSTLSSCRMRQTPPPRRASSLTE